MIDRRLEVLEEIQRLIATVIATNPAGHNLCLIGGFRYRFLDESCRLSNDVDYHWDGDLDEKQTEVVSLFKRKLLPEVKQHFGYDGTVSPATGPNADSPSVKIINLAFYRIDVSHSRIGIPVDITRIVCLDQPTVRTAQGVVYPTISDTDMIESKVISLFNRQTIEERDLVDLFLFENQLAPDSPERIPLKLSRISLPRLLVKERLHDMVTDRDYHVRAIKEIIDDQLDPQAVANINEAGGASMVFDRVCDVLLKRLKLSSKEDS